AIWAERTGFCFIIISFRLKGRMFRIIIKYPLVVKNDSQLEHCGAPVSTPPLWPLPHLHAHKKSSPDLTQGCFDAAV
ncbi:MAG: hypothetical protein KA346_01425, partial [Neisseriaceae bacterium]|nr:hypothetical protein [Neisseriaceae bacterium]